MEVFIKFNKSINSSLQIINYLIFLYFLGSIVGKSSPVKTVENYYSIFERANIHWGYLNSNSRKHLYWLIPKGEEDRKEEAVIINEEDTNNEEEKVEENKVPLILWVNTDYPSLGVLLLEIGPLIYKHKKLVPNKFPWRDLGDLLILNIPRSEAYSASTPPPIYSLILHFISLYPKYKGGNIYLVGEGIGGGYLSQFGKEILTKNDEDFLHLRGVILVSPILNRRILTKTYTHFIRSSVDPEMDIYSYVYLSTMGAEAAIVGEVDVNREWEEGLPFVGHPSYIKLFDTWDIRYSRAVSQHNGRGGRFALFENFAYNLYSNLGIPNEFTATNTNIINSTRSNVEAKDITNYLPYTNFLIEQSIPILFLCGEKDYMANCEGVNMQIESLTWKGVNQFKTQQWEDHKLADQGKVRGRIKALDGVRYLQVFDAGHMLFIDQPDLLFYLVKDFIYLHTQ